MKVIFTILIFVSSLTSFSQTDKVIGDYKFVVHALSSATNAVGTKDSIVFEYQLTLSPDKTFSFHYYSKHQNSSPLEENKYGKGNWSIENDVISFFSEKEKDLDKKNTLDFTDSKARFTTKSPRDKTDRIVPTKIIFLKSEIFWMERIQLHKIL